MTMSSTSLWYVATPYRKWPSGKEDAWKMASEQAGLLVGAGVPVFCPIAHSHSIARFGGIDPDDCKIWVETQDLPLMRACSGIIVVMAEGWKESEGMAREIEEFRAAGKPIVHMAPGQIPDIL
jgi:hypothetical protein